MNQFSVIYEMRMDVFGIEKGREWCLCRGTEIGQIDVMKCCNDDEEKE